MTYQQLLPIYQQETGLPGQDDAFNQWVQHLIDSSGSQTGVAGIPDGYVSLNPGQPTPTDDSTGQLINLNNTVVTPNVPGSNTNQVQNSVQNGGYSNTGTTTNSQNTTGSTSNVGTTTGTTTTGSTSSSNPNDTLGFGALLQGAQGQATANDATRNAYLTDLVNTGGAAYAPQTDAAIRSSLTGPQATGAGDDARARIAGDAAANVQRNNTDERLSAASQLAGPTATSSLSTAANPYVGTTNSSTNTGTTSGSTTNLANTFSSLMGTQNETGSGNATGSSSSAAAGTALQNQQQSGGGGCVLCTAAIELDLPHARLHRVLRVVINHKLHKDWKSFRNAARGYFFLFTPLARYLLRHPWIAATLWPLAKAVVYEELRVAGRPLPRRNWAGLVHWVGHGVCSVVGRFPVSGRVKDDVILAIARRENILFEVQS